MMNEWDEVREYVHGHDFSEEMAHGKWEAEVEADPMVTTSLRLPKSLLDWVRQQAAEQHLRPTALIRQWVEQRRDAGSAPEIEDLLARVQRLERITLPDQRAS